MRWQRPMSISGGQLHCCVVQSGSGQPQQRRVIDLEKELARLRRDGQASREELLAQLEAAKQAATQARHEAAQASARATYEASHVQQLQNDKARSADMVDNWKQQTREQQVGQKHWQQSTHALHNCCCGS